MYPAHVGYKGSASGFAYGLGAATADAVYGCIAGFGLAWVSTLLVNLGIWTRVISGLFLCYLGVMTLLSRPAETVTPYRRRLFTAFASTFGLTLANPLTILSFAAIFASLGPIGNRSGSTGALLLVVGVFMGSAIWWLLLTCSVSVLRHRVNNRMLLWINRISGAIICIFGLVTLAGIL